MSCFAIELFRLHERNHITRLSREDKIMWNDNDPRRKVHEDIDALATIIKDKFPDERTAREYVIERFKECATCPLCLAPLEDRSTDREAACRHCKCSWSITDNSLFERAKLFLPLLVAILFTEAGINLPATKLAELVGVAYSTAWECMRKVHIAFNSFDETTGTPVRSSDLAALFAKRSILTPASEHPIAEEQAWAARMCAVEEPESMPELTPKETEILDLFGRKPVSVDYIAERVEADLCDVMGTLSELEFKGLVKNIAGNQYKRTKSDPKKLAQSEDTVAIIRMICLHILFTSHGISRKYLQAYVGVIRRHVNLSLDSNMFLDFCRTCGPINRADIMAFVSPLTIHLKAA